jgi:isocitrate dehydrogenase
MIVDIGAARLATRPERFDVIVTPNLYGDILSDIAAEVAGSVGLAGSANIGTGAAMFEAIHGSAPDIAGQDVANPSGLLQAAVMMLVHVGQPQVAATIRNAWLRALEDGMHTADMAGPATVRTLGTAAFAQAVIDRLGQLPRHRPASALEAAGACMRAGPTHGADPASGSPAPADGTEQQPLTARPQPVKRIVGVDVFVDAPGIAPDDLAARLASPVTASPMRLAMITNRGVKVWPQGLPETFCTDHWRCRFLAGESQEGVDHADIIDLLARLVASGIDPIKTEYLCNFDGEPGFSLGQGQ